MFDWHNPQKPVGAKLNAAVETEAERQQTRINKGCNWVLPLPPFNSTQCKAVATNSAISCNCLQLSPLMLVIVNPVVVVISLEAVFRAYAAAGAA